MPYPSRIALEAPKREALTVATFGNVNVVRSRGIVPPALIKQPPTACPNPATALAHRWTGRATGIARIIWPSVGQIVWRFGMDRIAVEERAFRTFRGYHN